MNDLTSKAFDAAARFVVRNARLIDRHRFAYLFTGGDPDAVEAALRPYPHPSPDHHP